jgi:hypothetical protein
MGSPGGYGTQFNQNQGGIYVTGTFVSLLPLRDDGVVAHVVGASVDIRVRARMADQGVVLPSQQHPC